MIWRVFPRFARGVLEAEEDQQAMEKPRVSAQRASGQGLAHPCCPGISFRMAPIVRFLGEVMRVAGCSVLTTLVE
jgi:hypothetical protein